MRNSNREALTALRKIAKTSQSSVPVLGNNLGISSKDGNGEECRTCGDYDRSEPVWFLCSGSDVFLNIPFHEAHTKLEMGNFIITKFGQSMKIPLICRVPLLEYP